MVFTPEPAQPLVRRRPDAPQPTNGKRVEIGDLLPGLDLEHAGARLDPVRAGPRLGLDRRHLGQELVRGHADRARERQAVGDVGPDAVTDRDAVAEQRDRPGDVEKRLVERDPLDTGRVRLEHLVHLRARRWRTRRSRPAGTRPTGRAAVPAPTASPRTRRTGAPRTTRRRRRPGGRCRRRRPACRRARAGAAVRPTRRTRPCRRAG